MLEPVRSSFREDKSIEWVRVHNLPDYVYFDHSIHLNKGVGCVTCHGQVDEMPLTWRENSLSMEWCLDCTVGPLFIGLAKTYSTCTGSRRQTARLGSNPRRIQNRDAAAADELFDLS
jgi:hypothetical protein